MQESARNAAEHGCHGLEIRVHPDEEVHIGLAGGKLARARSTVEDSGLEVAFLAGYVKVCGSDPDEQVIIELRALIGLAYRLCAPAVRVFSGGEQDALPRVEAVLDDLRASGVQLLIETHDSHPTGAQAVQLVEPLGEPDLVAVLWDALHPWRHWEQPLQTRAVLGFFQIKDVAGVHDLTRWCREQARCRWPSAANCCAAGRVGSPWSGRKPGIRLAPWTPATRRSRVVPAIPGDIGLTSRAADNRGRDAGQGDRPPSAALCEGLLDPHPQRLVVHVDRLADHPDGGMRRLVLIESLKGQAHGAFSRTSGG
ncbi:hypothetical protein GCM10010178_39860 [Lentzea flava]|uniref:Xylose isomerase-like TIM barrel domain-containing protein n=1 Tax=Lentzea flava TaxID=103732 RepID=A0ABQ2UN63_9PSEU|nr:hypothetical protein GCM10010178_39860 [Lentzea flava]